MKLVILNEEMMPVFNPEARLIKEFNLLLTRDRGSVGDHDGRKKRHATKELCFIHFIASRNSEYVLGYPSDKREGLIKKALDLPDTWKPDEAVNAAIKVYKDLNYTPSLEALEEIKETLFSTTAIIKIIRRRLEEKISNIEAALNGAEANAALDSIMSDYDKITNISNKIPAQIETIQKLEDKVKKESQTELKGRGKVEVNDWEL